jgi:hypothetical protein
VRNLVTIAFFTGLRLGEIFAILPMNVKSDRLFVDGQMNAKRAKYSVTTTKTDSDRSAFLPEIVKPLVKPKSENS